MNGLIILLIFLCLLALSITILQAFLHAICEYCHKIYYPKAKVIPVTTAMVTDADINTIAIEIQTEPVNILYIF